MEDVLRRTELRASEHFLRRLRTRFPELKLTESRLIGQLLRATWFPATRGENIYYVPWRMGARTAIFVVAREERRLAILTVYQPSDGWARRISTFSGCSGMVIVNSAASRTRPSPYKGAEK